ncbi:hypothetical protein D3C87_1742630 [compost metagenome]
MLHAGQARWCERDRHRDILPDHGRRQRAVGHVDQHALTQLDLRKIILVGAVGTFGPCAAIGIIEEHFRHPATGHCLQIGDGKRLGHDNRFLLKLISDR